MCNGYPGAVVVLGHQSRPEVEGRVLGLADGALTRTYQEPMPPPVLPAVPSVGRPPVDLGKVTAFRGGSVGELIGDRDRVDGLGLDPEEHPLDLPTAQLRLAQAASVLAQDRDVVLMDEPDVGLDDFAVQKFWLMVREALAEGKAVIMTCHDGEFLEVASEWVRMREMWV